MGMGVSPQSDTGRHQLGLYVARDEHECVDQLTGSNRKSLLVSQDTSEVMSTLVSTFNNLHSDCDPFCMTNSEHSPSTLARALGQQTMPVFEKVSATASCPR